MSNSLLLLDFSHLFSRCFHKDYDPLAQYSGKACDRPELRTMVLTSLSNLIVKFKPRHVVAAMDCKPYWRSSLYSHYKENRHRSYNQEAFYCLKKEIEDDMKAIASNFIWLKVPGAEGDDIIGVLSESSGYDEIIVHGLDGDFCQLDALPKVRRYNPVKKRFIERLGDSGKELTIKIVCGDAGDNIPSVKKGVGPKTVLKMINEGKLEEWLDSVPEYRKAFELNSQLMDFRYIPSDLKNLIVSDYESQLKTIGKQCDIKALSKYMPKTSIDDGVSFAAIAAKLNGDWN